MLIDISLPALFAGRTDFRVTGSFDGEDLLNGGIHRAVDVGNFRMNDPISAPIAGQAIGLRHFDGALGVRYNLTNGYFLELWHLNATLAPLGAVQAVAKGQVCGRTGNTGARLPDGSPMPAHTHIVLERAGVKYDAEPYLRGKLFDTGGTTVAKLPGKFLRHVTNRRIVLRADANFRVAPFTNQPTQGVLAAGNALQPYVVVAGESIAGSAEWYGVVAYVGGAWRDGFVHSATAGEPTPIEGGSADCAAQDAKLAAIAKIL